MTKQWSPLTDSQWIAISPFLPIQRKRQHDLRRILDAILWLLRTGCQWRNLPFTDLPWQSVYYYFHRWKQDGTVERLNIALNALDRLNSGREALPSALCIDTQTIKLTPMSGEHRGMDAYKRVNGRKRTFVVDTQGRLWVAQVGAADQADGTLGVSLISQVLWRVGERLEKVFGDQAASAVRLQWGVCPCAGGVEHRL